MSNNHGNGTTNRNAGRNGNAIRGPHSALTDFLASYNISADQIRRTYEARQQAAASQAASQDVGQDASDVLQNVPDDPEGELERPAQAKKRKREEEKGIERLKKNLKLREGWGRRRLPHGEKREPLTEEAETEYVRQLYRKSLKPTAGQLENCAVCGKRFTVTAYTKAGPQGGLVCFNCAKDLDDGEGKAPPKKKAPPNQKKRRQYRSDLLDGVIQRGAKSLLQLSVQTIADQIDNVEDFGELSTPVLDQLSRILSKRRVLDSRTLNFFLRPEYETVALYDAAALKTNDFKRIFATCPNIKFLLVDNAGQFKDEVLQYVTGNPAIKLVHFRVGCANLIKDDIWRMFFAIKGQALESIKLTWMDNHFNDETFSHLVRNCTSLSRLKVERLWKIGPKSVESMAKIKQLKHLTFIRPFVTINSKHFVKLLKSVGKNLETFCLNDFPEVDDELLAHIHNNCRSLTKLRVTSNAKITDKAFVKLFTDWKNPPLKYVSFQWCRHVDAKVPHQNPEGIGLCGDGFIALMQHSGSRIEHLYATSCRHITEAAFSTVFDGKKTYPQLKVVCVSFCGAVNEPILYGMFKSCPNLKKVLIFACFKAANVVAPRGVILLGRANGCDQLAIEGEEP